MTLHISMGPPEEHGVSMGCTGTPWDVGGTCRSLDTLWHDGVPEQHGICMGCPGTPWALVGVHGVCWDPMGRIPRMSSGTPWGVHCRSWGMLGPHGARLQATLMRADQLLPKTSVSAPKCSLVQHQIEAVKATTNKAPNTTA